MRSLVAAVALVSALVMAGTASAKTYTCKINPKGTTHSVPTDVIITHNESTGNVMVMDNFIKSYVGKPIAGTLRSSNANRVLFGWTLSGIKAESGQYTPGITYSINIQRANGRADISGKPQGYADHWRGSGTCKVK